MGRALTQEDVACGLEQLGLKAGGKVLVHASLSSLGRVVGGAEALVDALREAVSPGGTVMVPTLTGSREDSPTKLPRLDVRSTPTWCGTVPETLRRRSDAVRSLHPTHSVAAMGADAEPLTSGHEQASTPCGWDSPYGKLARSGGYILLLGVGHDRNTTFHAAEEIAGMPYMFQPGHVTTNVVDAVGNEVAVRTRLHRWDVPRDFERWHMPLVEAGIVECATVGHAHTRLMRSSELIRFLTELLASDPQALLRRQT